ncbi:MAG: hypothetical protein K6C68_13095 [Ruminococcus sp.]|nr:hypothetical protein [Ruminococcus sp.]
MAKDFADEVMQELKRYCNGIGEEMLAEAQVDAVAARAELKKASPKRTGTYAKSWRLTKFGGTGRFRFVIYNDVYQLTYLLEEGFTHHPDMEKVEGQTHIEPIQEELNLSFEKEVERIIKNKS